MSNYEITADGRLIKHAWDYEATPEDELPYKDKPKGSLLRLFGAIRHKAGSYRIEDQEYHGMLNFYGDVQSGELRAINLQAGEDRLHPGPEPEWYEYNAKFTDGRVVEIIRAV